VSAQSLRSPVAGPATSAGFRPDKPPNGVGPMLAPPATLIADASDRKGAQPWARQQERAIQISNGK
jgi:hypothetical protein